MQPATSFAQLTLSDFLAQTAAKTPAPGGGAVAAAIGALAAALAQMVVAYSLGKKNLAEHQPHLESAAARLEKARFLLLTMADEDAAAYGLVNELSRLPEGDPRRVRLAEAQEVSVQIPLAAAAVGLDLLRLFDQLSTRSNRHLRSDLAIAAIAAEACVRASACNVRINLAALPIDQAAPAAAEVVRMVTESLALCASVERATAA